jgi:hypothetical protein
MDRYFLHMEFPSKDKTYWEEEIGWPQTEDESDFPGWEVWEFEEVSDVYDCLQKAGEKGKSFIAQWSGYDCNQLTIAHAGQWEDTNGLDCQPVVPYGRNGPNSDMLKSAQNFWAIYDQLEKDALGGE